MGVFKRPPKPKKGQHQYWYMRCQYKGREYWESTGKRAGEITKDEALRMFSNWKDEIKTGIKKPVRASDIPDSPTFYEFASEYVKQKKSEGKTSWDRDVYSINNLLDFFDNNILIQDISPELVSKYKSHRLRNRKPETVNHELRCLSAIINLARDWEIYAGKNPVRTAGLVKYNRERRKTLTPAQDRLLIQSASEHFVYIIIAALHTGMRRGEIAKAKIEHVNLEQKYLYVPASKTANDRIIPLNKTMMDMVTKLIERSRDVFLFTNKNGYHYQDPNSLTLIFRRLCRKNNIQNITFHSLRHTAATRMLEGKTDDKGNKIRASLVDVQLILGHKKPKTTMIYLNPEDSLKDAVELLG